MSVYKEIKTEFKNPQSLLQALADLDVNIQCAHPKENLSKLVSHWHGHKPQDVAIAVQRDDAVRVGIGNLDGVGFRWTGSGYVVVQDQLDQNKTSVTEKMNKLKQRYAFHEVVRQAKSKGYTVKTEDLNGTLRVTLVKR